MAKKKGRKVAAHTKQKAAARRAPKKPAPARKDDSQGLRVQTMNPSLTVDNLDRSIAWYRDVLGCVVGELWRHDDVVVGAELKAGDVTIMISQDDWKLGRHRVKGSGFRLFCLTTQDVDRLAAGIRARGGTLIEEPRDEWGMRVIAVEDPDGFKFSIARRLSP